MSVSDLLSGEVAGDAQGGTRSAVLGEDDGIFDALATETARRILRSLRGSRKTASEVAADTGISIQNVAYHLDRLEESALIADVGTRYSSKAREMNVYTATDDRIVVHIDGTADRPE